MAEFTNNLVGQDASLLAVRPANEVSGVISPSICADALLINQVNFLALRLDQGSVMGLSVGKWEVAERSQRRSKIKAGAWRRTKCTGRCSKCA